MIRGFGIPPDVPVAAIPTLGEWSLAALALLLAAAAFSTLRRRRSATPRIFLALLAGCLVALPAMAAPVTVDDFSTAQAQISAPPAASSSVGGAGVLGTNRDLELDRISGAGSDTAEVSGGSLLFTVAAGDVGALTVTYDGDTDPDTFDASGLGGADLTGGGTNGGLRINAAVAANPASLVVEVFTDAANSSTAAVLLPVGAAQDFHLAFSEFLVGDGTGADFADVGAVVLKLQGEDGAVVTLNEIVAAVPVIASTKTDALTSDVDMDGQADPGDRLTYTVTITNTGSEALSVDLNDMVDANTTLVMGSVASTPVAKGDQYRAVGNVTLNVNGALGRPGLLANDRDPDGNPGECTGCTVTALRSSSGTPNVSDRGGSLSLVDGAQGFFGYVPPAGARGVDSFVYDIDDGEGNAATATVTVNIEGIVWFVDNTHTGPFEGTQANPFNATKAAEAASAPGDIIRVRAGDGTATGHNLGHVMKDDQILVGGAADLVIGGELIEAGTTHSVHSHGAGHVLELADNNTILGVALHPSFAGSHAVAGVGSSNATLDNVIISPSGAGGGILLNGHTGGFTFANSAVTATSSTLGKAVEIAGGGGSFDFSGSPIALDGGSLITVTGLGAGATVNFTGSMPTLTNGIDDGIVLSGNPGATFTFDAIGSILITGPAIPMLGGGAPLTIEVEGIFISSSGTVNLNTIGPVDVTNGLGVSISGTTVVKAGGPGAITLASLASTFGTVGLLLNGVAPAVTVTGTTSIGNATAAGIDLTSSGAVTFGGQLAVGTLSGAGLRAVNTGLVTATAAGSSISANGGPGVDITGTALNMSLATLTSTNSGAQGLSFSAASGTLTAAGGTITGVLNGNRGISVNGGSLSFTYGGTVNYTANDYAVRIQDTSSGFATFNAKVSAGAASLGLYVSNADSNATFADLDLGTSGSPMTHSAINLLNGSNGTFSFADTQVFTNGAAGVIANNGGVVQFTGAGNRVSATNGRAITFENGTTIGAMGATFERVDASGTDRGIRLASAGSGFAVTGNGPNGTDGTGGTLQNLTTRGIEVLATNNVTFQNMNLTDAATANGVDPTNANGTCGGLALGGNLGCNAPVHLETVVGAVLDNVDVLRSAQIGINGNNVSGFALRNSTVTDAGNEANEFSLKFRDLLGTSEITNSTVRRTISAGTEVDQVRIQNLSSTPLDLTVTNSHFDTNAADGPTSAFENSGFIAVGHASADMRLTFVNSFFENNKGSGLTVGVSDTASSATVDYIVSGGTFRNNNVGVEAIGHGVASTITFDINGATVDDNPAVGINVDLNSSSAAGVTLQGHVRNNNVTHTGAGDSIQVNTRGAGHAIVTITGNTLNESGFERAIDVSTQEGSGDLDVVITGNTLNMSGVNPVRAMNVNSGAAVGDSGTMCAKVGGATVAERNTVNSISGGTTAVRVRRRESTVVNLQGVPGPHPQTDQATIEAYITSQNTGATGQATVGAGFGDAMCLVAPLP
ncbi:MAG: IPTL-CTERM sorting domain-containing protein [Acidobacteria bacterium]|nr:IPTL-CTERM sorting domain-containing protein [Acidobacteriota bacterium]